MGFPVLVARYPNAAEETKLGKAGYLLVMILGAGKYMLPTVLHRDSNERKACQHKNGRASVVVLVVILTGSSLGGKKGQDNDR